MKKALVTGITGQDGSYLAEKAPAAAEIPKLDRAGLAAVLEIIVEIGRRSH